MTDWENKLNRYSVRFGGLTRQLDTKPATGLRMVVVIPCFAEPDALATLNSLRQCQLPKNPVEVLLVVNGAETATDLEKEQNEKTCADFGLWRRTFPGSKALNFEILNFPSLPKKSAGVGLARKLGMDEALWRFVGAETMDLGVIVCLDADSLVEKNYFVALENHFESHPDTPACSIHFEHPLAGDLDENIYRGATLYELHLRYYVEGLRFAGLPYAFHTIGSSMAVRAPVYMEQGGMNRRQAGEDFYFLNKIIPLGGYSECLDTTVFPSPRISNRVPFGTGRAISNFLERGELNTYPMEIFDELREFSETMAEVFLCEGLDVSRIAGPSGLGKFLPPGELERVLDEIWKHAATSETRAKRLWRWFDGFLAMKFANFARENLWAAGPVEIESRRLLARLRRENLPTLDSRELLAFFRQLQHQRLRSS